MYIACRKNCLKNNHILDQGLTLPFRTVINRSVFQKVLDTDGTELKLCPKLSTRHLSVSVGTESTLVSVGLYLFMYLLNEGTGQGKG